MGRYTQAQDAVNSIFGSAPWLAENIPAFPQDVVPDRASKEYVRVSVIPSAKGLNKVSVSGICILDIYTADGEGPARALAIADVLDKYMHFKTVQLSAGLSLEFKGSTLQGRGADKANPSLTRSQYTVPFNLYGVSN